MTVTSGQVPYQYDWPTPFRVRHNEDVGISGIHLEAAQFVIQAELRKFQVSDAFTTAWRVFTNQSSPLGSGYDPKANGATLNGLVGSPVVVDLDHIALMRLILVLGLWSNGYDGTTYDSASLLEDWIRQAYPESPSGYKSDQLDGQFLRPVLQEDGQTYIPGTSANALTGVFTDTDPHWLGGSGIILDIDVGEVMWNPYPSTFNFNSTAQNSNDFHGRIDGWGVISFPFFPAFQKTDGSLVSLNGFENKWPQDPPTGLALNLSPTNSGAVRFCAYPIFGNTEFFFARLNSPLSEVYKMEGSTDKMTVVAESIAPIGLASRNVAGSTVYLDPIPLGTGLYRIACKNARANFPHTTVESGVTSQWPTVQALGLHITGYEVFNNCFWITDWGQTAAGSAGPAGPSGLSVISPFTANTMWQRNATDDVGGQVWDVGASTLRDVRWWWNSANSSMKPYLSLQRIAADQIVRLVGASEGTVPLGGPFGASVAIYADDLASVTNQAFSLSLPASAAIAELNNMVFDGTFYWIGGTIGGGTAKTWQLDSSFNEVDRLHSRILQERAGYVSDGLGGAQKLVGFGTGGNIAEYEVIAETGGQPEDFEMDAVATKALAVPSLPTPTTTVAEIYSIIEISGIPEIKDGVYAFVRTTGPNRLYILRITEGVTSWSIAQHFLIGTFNNSYNPDSASYIMGMLAMPVG